MKSFFSICLTAVIPGQATFADPVCMDAFEMEAALIDWYAETPVKGALVDAQQLWASDETGTWTLVELGPGGTACVLGQGDGWRSEDEPWVALERSLDEQGDRAPASAIAFLDLLLANPL